jgi:hypothetical protein
LALVLLTGVLAIPSIGLAQPDLNTLIRHLSLYLINFLIFDVGLGSIGIVRSKGAAVIQFVTEGLIALGRKFALLLPLRVFNASSVEEVCRAG